MSELTLSPQNTNLVPLEDLEPSTFRLVMTLAVAGFFSGLILVGIFLVTQPMIEANKAAALKEAIFKVLPGCKDFKTLELRDGKLFKVQSEGGNAKSKTEKIFAGFNENGNFIGFAIPGGEPGFQDIISGIFGFEPGKAIIIGFEVLESKETPGLGDKIMKDKGFQANFKALAVDPEIIAVKPGKKAKVKSGKYSNEVETITGATISSKAVVRLLDKTVKKWKKPIKEYLKSNTPGKAGSKK
ncbi:FMN-binding protein [Candidatus Riflebacteria bacterium]